MGKRIRVQRRGRGGSQFRASSHKRRGPAKYLSLPVNAYLKKTHKGEIKNFFHDPGRGAPLAFIHFESGQQCYNIIPEGVFEKQEIEMGGSAEIKIGNILPLIKIPESTMICNIELHPGDGGKLVKSSGTYATVIAHDSQGTLIRLPSGVDRYFNDACRATIGVVSGSGRTEKPFLKAGVKFHYLKAKGQKYPRTRGRAMVAAAHPYGSSKKSARKGTTVSRHAPPGQKVGLIASRGTRIRRKRK
jgi:large subunit ribosomal protein L2